MKAGLEIHQRLSTKRKLFCKCKNGIGKKREFSITRKLRTSEGESGAVDKASQWEAMKGKVFEYTGDKNNCCLVELDEEPPIGPDTEAVETCVEICSLLGCEILEHIQFMRKIVVDGSNTSGFQRTAIVGINGKCAGVGIETVCLEEESAGIIERSPEKDRYLLDRLGIPLVEIATSPDITSPKQLVNVAEEIGTLLRTTGKVSRGIGTIRQDVNISIEGGNRVEIKGCQNLKMLEKIAEEEITRQESLIRLEKKIRELSNRQKLEIVNLTEIFGDSENNIVKKHLKKGGCVLGAKLLGYRGILGAGICSGRRFGTEVSDYAKTAGVGGIMHSDENPEKYCLEEEFDRVGRALGLGEEDAFIITVGMKEECERAIERAFVRAITPGVPKETRKANPDGTSSFLRPMPGSARMYPETDIRVLKVEHKVARKGIGGVREIRQMLERMLNKDFASQMLKSRYLNTFLKLVKEGNDPKECAKVFLQVMKKLKREGVELSEEDAVKLIRYVGKGKIVPKAIGAIAEKAAREGRKIEDVVEEGEFSKMSEDELRRVCEEEGWDIGKIMAKHGLRTTVKDIRRLMKK